MAQHRLSRQMLEFFTSPRQSQSRRRWIRSAERALPCADALLTGAAGLAWRGSRSFKRAERRSQSCASVVADPRADARALPCADGIAAAGARPRRRPDGPLLDPRADADAGPRADARRQSLRQYALPVPVPTPVPLVRTALPRPAPRRAWRLTALPVPAPAPTLPRRRRCRSPCRRTCKEPLRRRHCRGPKGHLGEAWRPAKLMFWFHLEPRGPSTIANSKLPRRRRCRYPCRQPLGSRKRWAAPTVRRPNKRTTPRRRASRLPSPCTPANQRRRLCRGRRRPPRHLRAGIAVADARAGAVTAPPASRAPSHAARAGGARRRLFAH